MALTIQRSDCGFTICRDTEILIAFTDKASGFTSLPELFSQEKINLEEMSELLQMIKNSTEIPVFVITVFMNLEKMGIVLKQAIVKVQQTFRSYHLVTKMIREHEGNE